MKTSFKRFWHLPFLVCLFLCVMLFHNQRSKSEYHEPPSQNSQPSSESLSYDETAQITGQTEPLLTPISLDTSITRSDSGELLFAASMDTFIECYNRLYEIDYRTTFLRPLQEWSFLVCDNSPYSDAPSILYEFKLNKKVLIEPTITAYVPSDGIGIQEITLGFQEHSWTDWCYDRFREECGYVFQLFFPSLTDGERNALFETLFDDAYDKECYVDLYEERSPTVLRYLNDVGVYCVLHCGVIRFCLIPVDSQYLEDFTSSGGILYEI